LRVKLHSLSNGDRNGAAGFMAGTNGDYRTNEKARPNLGRAFLNLKPQAYQRLFGCCRTGDLQDHLRSAIEFHRTASRSDHGALSAAVRRRVQRQSLQSNHALTRAVQCAMRRGANGVVNCACS
jgi:hypothetical protein